MFENHQKLLGFIPNPLYVDRDSLLARIAAGEIQIGDKGGTRFVALEKTRRGKKIRFIVTAVGGDAAYQREERPSRE